MSIAFTNNKREEISIKALSANTILIENSGSKYTLEIISSARSRVTCVNQSGNLVLQYDLISNESFVMATSNGKTIFSQPKQLAPKSSSATSSDSTADAGDSIVSSDWYYTEYWDGIQFVYSGDAAYPHPDKDYYYIPTYSDWSTAGNYLYHIQVNYAVSQILMSSGAVAIGGFIGAVIGSMFAPPLGTAIGLAVGAIAAAVLYYGVPFLDEYGNLWYWLGQQFLQDIYDNLWWLAILFIVDIGLVALQLLQYWDFDGYLRVGAATFNDPRGYGGP